MIELDLDLDPLLVELACNMAMEAVEALKQQPDDRFVSTDPEDPDLAEAWAQGLREELNRDFKTLTDFFSSGRLGKEPIHLSLEHAEELLRACSAVRFWVRTHRLALVSDEDLETGGVRLDELDPDTQIGYFTYGLLAYVQESLIDLLSEA